MSWKDVKRLNEERGEVLHQMKQMLNKAEEEKRDLSQEESGQFDQLNSKSEHLLEQRQRYEAVEQGEQRQAGAGGMPPELLALAKPSGFENRTSAADIWTDRTTGSEIPVLEQRDSFAAAVASERRSHGYGYGEGSAYRDLTPGQFLRSMVTGPSNPVERRALGENTDSAGGYAVPQALAGAFIDLLRARTTVLRAGARTVPIAGDSLRIAKIASDPTASWRSENASIAESDPSFGSVDLLPKSLAVLVRVSRELLADSRNIEDMLTASLTGALATELDRAALFGSGTGNEPVGLVNISGVAEIQHDEALSDYAPLVSASRSILEANAPPPTSAIMSPRDAATFGGLVDSTGQPLQRPDYLRELTFRQTSSVPVDQGVGSNESSIILGGFASLLLGIRSDLRIEILTERFADQHQIGLIAHLRADVAVEHAGSFARISGITP